MMTNRFLQTLRGERTDRAPFWFMRQAGRYLPEYREWRAKAPDFVSLCLSPNLAVEITLQPIRRYGMDAAILFSDILMVPHGLDVGLRFEEGRGPVLDAVHESGPLPRYDAQAFHATLAPVYDTVSGIRAKLSPETALIGFAGSPWTVATYMVEGGSSKQFEKVKGWAYRDSRGFSHLLDVLVESTLAYLSRQVEAGAQALQLFDSWAGVLDETLFESCVIAPTKRLVSELKARHPDVPIIGFARKAGHQLERYIRETGIDAAGLDETVPLATAEALPGVIQGNLDNILLANSREGIVARARALQAAWAGKPHVVNLGHGVIPSTPPGHVDALARVLRGE